MMSIPYLRPNGGPLGVKFRRLEGEGTKYDSPSGQQQHLFNTAALLESPEVVAICEGELDTIACQSVLGVAAVGTPGASVWFDHYPRCFADIDQVLIVADNDEKEDGSNPGLKHAKRVQAALSGSRIVLPPAGLDLGEWLLRDGAEAVKKEMGVE